MPVLITTPFPSDEDTARALGVSKKRMKALHALADEVDAIVTRSEHKAAVRTTQRRAPAKRASSKKKK